MSTTATCLNVAAALDHHVRLAANREAVIGSGHRLSYGDLNALSNKVANALTALGLKRGDHVALSCPNLLYFPIIYFGILKAGCVVVPLNVLFKTREIAYHLQDSDARAYFCFEGTPELPMSTWASEAFAQVDACEHFIVMTADPSRMEINGFPTWSALVADTSATFETVPTSAEDTAVILYTSGTTGQPKGAELTHLNLQTNLWSMVDVLGPFTESGPDAHNVILITLPLFHSFGQVTQMLLAIVLGCPMVLLPRFDPATVLKTMKDERVTSWSGVPTMYWALAEYARTNAVDTEAIRANLRICNSGGAPLPVELMKRLETCFGVRILEGYGLSETSPVATFNNPARPSKPGTVGIPIQGVEVMVVDSEDRRVPTGEIGEVVIRGPNVMKGYYKRPAATEEALRNGWFHSGDLGRLDEDGYLTIVDRTKDMILRGGYNVYPREIEEVLMAHPAVSLCAVVGIPDERLGEEIKAYIVRCAGVELTEEGMLTWCRDQFASYKVPRAIEFRDSLPMTATGKVLKRALR